MTIPSFPVIQEQVAQLKLTFNAPLVKDSQVQSLSDLLTLSYNYDHRLVWVIDEADYYYLLVGKSGNAADHWAKFSGSAIITPYNPLLSYPINNVVTYYGKLYISIALVDPGIHPINTDYWEPLLGNVSLKFDFTDQSEILIESPVEYPKFQVYSTATIPVSLIEAFVELTSDTGIHDGAIWKISFEEASAPKILSGYIILSS